QHLTAAGVSLRRHKNDKRRCRSRKSSQKSQPRKVGAKMERLEKLKLILGIEGTEQDDLLEYLLESTEQKILNYCNIKELPAELEDILIEMAARFYNSLDGVAASMKVGDTSVNYSTAKDEQNIIHDYKAQLYRF